MKEDILEQLVEDWLQAQGYFTRANLKFKPSRTHPDYNSQKDSVASDVDVIGVNPLLHGPERVMVVGCKSWMDGFWCGEMARYLVNKPDHLIGGKAAWKHFRELVVPRWSEAFLEAVKNVTGCTEFTYVTAVAVLREEEDRNCWENNAVFKAALHGNSIRLITLQEMLARVFSALGTSVESSQFSRTLQLIKAAGMTVSLKSD